MIVAHEEYNLPVLRHRHMSLCHAGIIYLVGRLRLQIIPLNHVSHVRRLDARENVLGGDIDASTVLEHCPSTFPPPTLIECTLE